MKQIGGRAADLRMPNAFGMGIDKLEVQFFIHRDVPKRTRVLDQEMGGAWWDGLVSSRFLTCTRADVRLAKGLAGAGIVAGYGDHPVELTVPAKPLPG